MPKQLFVSIVDDDKSVREAIEGLMRSVGYTAQSFASAREFLASRALRRTACLILDVNMPGMTGPELYGHLVASNIAIPTILITAYPDEEVRARALAAGAICYLGKPFDEATLLGCIHSALGTTQPE